MSSTHSETTSSPSVAPTDFAAQRLDSVGLDRGMRGWIVNTAKRNYWRVAGWYDIEDLIQDGYMCFAKCRRKYPRSGPKQLMALVKVTFINYIHDLSKQRTRQAETTLAELVPPGVTEAAFLETLLDPIAPEQDVISHIMKAPDEIRRTLELLTSEYGIARWRAQRLRKPDGTRESLNDMVCRLLRVDPKNNLIEGARHWLES